MNEPDRPKKKHFIRQDINFAQGGVTLRQGLVRIGLHRALRRSIFITVSKRFLPFIALMITAVVLAWPYLVPDGQKFSLEAKNPPDYDNQHSSLFGLKFIGTDSQNQTYTITSSRADQSNDRSGKIILTRPTGDLAMKNKGWFFLSSDQGVFYNRERRIELHGNVVIHSSEGFELHTETIAVNLLSRDMDANQPVTGQSPALSLAAEGLRIRQNGELIDLVGKSRVSVRTEAGGTAEARPFASSPAHAP
ncbi:MAG: LPS export ABC transporter periplasmic protein LptC [Alphaproteobacteria bacterium]|nr:LPS export ABC transporter periplasmic protein LptC [Alphaproteobacteria bacterium]